VTNIPLPTPKKIIQRNSVSAEAYGEWNRKELFKAKVVPKSETTAEK
jgi:hypothetical protein